RHRCRRIARSPQGAADRVRAATFDGPHPRIRADERGRTRPPEVEPLPEMHAEALQRGQLAGCLDAFGDEVELERLTQGDDRAGDRLVLPVDVDALDEGLVDLEDVEREPAQVGQRGVAGPEV